MASVAGISLVNYFIQSISFRYKHRKVHQKLLAALQIQNIFFGKLIYFVSFHENLLRSKSYFSLALLSRVGFANGQQKQICKEKGRVLLLGW